MKTHPAPPCLLRAAFAVLVALFLLTGPTQAQLSPAPIRFAVIGDYGVDSANQQAVADRLKTYNPQFITTTGDNNYLSGSVADWDRTQGKYYGEFIKYPAGGTSAYAGNGVTENNFFPTLGNHDWDAGVTTYTDYFDLPTSVPGGERYYSFTRGAVQFFMISSDPREPDGNTPDSAQAAWLQSAMQSSTAPWKHHPAYTSPSLHRASENMRWDFAGGGASVVLSGHNHTYERLSVGSLPYFVNGVGGNSLYNFTSIDSDSQYRDNTEFGFMLVDADATSLQFRFITAAGVERDSLTLTNNAVVAPEPASLLLLLPAAVIALARTALLRRRKVSL